MTGRVHTHRTARGRAGAVETLSPKKGSITSIFCHDSVGHSCAACQLPAKVVTALEGTSHYDVVLSVRAYGFRPARRCLLATNGNRPPLSATSTGELGNDH